MASGKLNQFWTAAQTRYSQEGRAECHVERMGYEFWMPRMYETRGSREVRVFMFPGYIFIRIKDGWQELCSARGIARLFTRDGVPVRVRDGDIAKLRSLEDGSGYVRLAPRFTDGDAVEISEGPYQGLTGIVAGMSAAGRCRVLFSFMRREVTAEFEERIIRAA